jgi:diacylglycerol kinase family enzyme
MDRRLKVHFGRLSIALQGLAQWWRYSYPELEVRLDGRATTARQLAVCNIPEYGGSFRIVSGGRWDDGRLDVVLFHGRGRRATFGFFADLVRGRHESRSDVEVTSADRVELVGPAGVDVQIDGDSLAATVPVLLRLAEQPLRVLVPA